MKNQANIQGFLKQHKTAIHVLNEKKSNSAMFVGGCVRDILKGEKNPEDIDISTILKPEQVVKAFNGYKDKTNANITILDKDKQYGTIVVIIDERKYEITTTRSDILCFGREAKVEFCENFEEDSKRRDFTMNALYMNANGEIFDFHNGIGDLENNTIKFIGEPDKRIKEDYLRIIRFFRFSAKYNNTYCDEQTKIAIQHNKNGLLNLSRERVKSELWKLLEYDNWFFGLLKFEEFDLIENIFLIKSYATNEQKPEKFDTQSNKKLNFYQITKLFYFFNFNTEMIKSFFENLKFTKKEKQFTEFLIKNWNLFANNELNTEQKTILMKDENSFYKEILWLLDTEKANKIIAFKSTEKPLPIKPDDLINLGFSGKEIGEKLTKLNKIWIESDFKLQKKELLKLI